MQEETLPSKDKKIDENQPGPSQRRSERLSHLEKPTVWQLNLLLHVVTLKDVNSFIEMFWMNVFLTHFSINAKDLINA